MNTFNTMIPMSRMIDAALNNHLESRLEDPRAQAPSPRADILEGATEYRIVMDMPGVKTEDLDISLENQLLVVNAERNLEIPEEFESRRRERLGHTSYSRSFTLSNVVETDKISAHLNEGVLQLILPKSEKSMPRQIEIQ